MTTHTTGTAELPEALPRYREYMHLRTTGAWSSGVPGWQRLITAPADEIVLVAAEFDRPGDWRIKCGYFDKQTTTLRVFGASWEPTHWMPLPPAPSSEGESNV